MVKAMKTTKCIAKKLLGVALVLCLIICSLPLSASADMSMVIYMMPENGGFLRLNKYTGALVDGVNINGPVTIPKKIEDYDVLSISDNAFKSQAGVTSVTIPEGVTSIGDNAFEGCVNLKTLSIAEGLSYVGSSAFKGAIALSELSLPNSISYIGNYAFANCTSITSMKVPSEMRDISKYTFSGCTKLSSVTLPSGLKRIGEYAFEGCTALEGITIPNDVTLLNTGAFSDCTKLSKVELPKKLEILGASVFANCTSLKQLVIKEGLTKLNNYTFTGCTNLQKLQLPVSISSISGEAFTGAGKFTAYVQSASFAQVYAAANNIPFVLGEIDDDTTDPPPVEPGKTPFIDVKDHWAEGDIAWAYEGGIVNGKTSDIFAPDESMDRAQFAAVLHRMEGEPDAEPAKFEDVRENVYYSVPVGWANENGIINGKTDTLYKPLDLISRQELAVMLYRLAEHKDYDMTSKSDLSVFDDYDDISGYAKDALSWAVAEKVMNGNTSTTLNPKGNATRAQVCAMLHRFSEL